MLTVLIMTMTVTKTVFIKNYTVVCGQYNTDKNRKQNPLYGKKVSYKFLFRYKLGKITHNIRDFFKKLVCIFLYSSQSQTKCI